MADIIQFPQTDNDLLNRVESLLAEYSAERIILALVEKATELADIQALMPSFSAIVDKQDK